MEQNPVTGVATQSADDTSTKHPTNKQTNKQTTRTYLTPLPKHIGESRRIGHGRFLVQDTVADEARIGEIVHHFALAVLVRRWSDTTQRGVGFAQIVVPIGPFNRTNCRQRIGHVGLVVVVAVPAVVAVVAPDTTFVKTTLVGRDTLVGGAGQGAHHDQQRGDNQRELHGGKDTKLVVLDENWPWRRSKSGNCEPIFWKEASC